MLATEKKKERMSDSRMREIALALMQHKYPEGYPLLPKLTATGLADETALNIMNIDLMIQGIEVNSHLRERVIAQAKTLGIPADEALEFTRLVITAMVDVILADNEETFKLKL